MDTELERLVVRLVGDGDDYINMLKNAESQTKDSAKGMEDTLTQLTEKISQALLGFSLKGLLDKATDEYDTMIRTQIKLESAISASGQAVDSVLPDFQAFAAGIQEITEMGDDSVLALLKTATNLGLMGDAAKNATEDAIALGAAGEVSAETALRITAAMEQGDIKRAQMFSRSIAALRGVKDEQEFQEKYQKLLASGWESATKEAKTFTGQINQLKNMFGDLFEEFGAILAEALTPFIDIGKQIVKWFQELDPAVKSSLVAITLLGTALLTIPPVLYLIGAATNAAFGGLPALFGAAAIGISALVGYMGGFAAVWDKVKAVSGVVFSYLESRFNAFMDWLDPVTDALGSLWDTVVEGATFAWDWVQERVGEFMTWLSAKWADNFGAINETVTRWRDNFAKGILVIEFALRNFGQVSEMIWTKMKLDVVTTYNEFEYMFTEMLPALLRWFADEFPAVFSVAVQNAGMYLKNLVGNVNNVLNELDRLIKGEISWDDVWKPLDTGFKKHMVGLPKVFARQIGPMEKELRDKIQEMAPRLQGDLNKFILEKQVGFMVDDIGGAWGKFFDGVFQGADAVEQKTRETTENLKESNKEAKSMDAALRGSAEALSRVAAFREGKEDRRAKRTEAAEKLAQRVENRERREGAPMAAAINAVKEAVNVQEEKTRAILQQILAALVEQAEGAGVQVDFADLEA